MNNEHAQILNGLRREATHCETGNSYGRDVLAPLMRNAADMIDALAARDPRPQDDRDIGPDPDCRDCHGTGECSNAQFRCPCRWSHHRAGLTEWGKWRGYPKAGDPRLRESK